ncbi:U3 small nucleolar RNA-associated protein 14 homolog A [Nematolebias whitei]|uniref:U3 small nucleolar RNA-associated protein 14 homolog A n=1 Tax=Nematolebias whitei TaxID=451745 RepID=UPI001899AAF9|nr:U3 small nucleolar RNA-associated protein 14 homolog A [Nematolebias whitei]
MAKVSKKRGTKKKSRQGSEEPGSSRVKTVVHHDDEDDGFNGADDEDVSSAEDEEENERKHQKLLEAISALGGKKRTLGERSEAATHMSEFTVSAEGGSDKVELSDLIRTVEAVPAVSARSRKQLKELQQSRRTVDCPLSKQETQRIHRDLAFQKAATEVSRWTSIINQNQMAEQLRFPLNPEPSGPRPMERVVTGWKAQTPLEQEVFALLSANQQPINDPVLTPVEEASVRAMSLEDAKIRRAELQKARALQSYYESKARREKKIKSKKYHRVQNKAKRKDLLKNFEEMVKVDPEAALEELKKMELARMQERMSLKHQNSSKWARSRAIMAKYDEGARRAMQEQLEVNRELTQKLVTSLKEEEEEEEEEEEGDADLLPDFVNAAELQQDSSNPWMRGRLSEESTEMKMSSMTAVDAAEEQEEVQEPEEEVLLREMDLRRKQRQAQDSDTADVIVVDDDDEEEVVVKVQAEEKQAEASDDDEEEVVMKVQAEEKRAEASDDDEKEVVMKVQAEEKQAEASDDEEEVVMKVQAEEKQAEASDDEEVVVMKVQAEEKQAETSDDEEEEAGLSEFTRIFRGLTKDLGAPAAAGEASAELEEGLIRIRSVEDAEDLPEEPPQAPPSEPSMPLQAPPPEPPPSERPAGPRRKRKGVELREVLTKETKVLAVPLAPTIMDSEEQLDQRGLIREAFAGDDVVSDFIRDKRKQEEAGKPKVLDLTLPGWGEWGGLGIKPSTKKRRRFRTKMAPPPPRKDRLLPSVIISEKRTGSVGLHQVSSLPFPFETCAQFESCIRSPLGRTWNTEHTVKKVTRPRVVTRLGVVIEPMDEEELLKEPKSQNTPR